MGKTLVVVESPAKAKTIKKYLGPGYEVLASKGHVKDLPKKMGIDVEHGFTETYEVIENKAGVLAELKSEARKSDAVLLATDPDREGEAIAWHIADELKRPSLDIRRVEFHEITKKGVEAGLKAPRALDAHLYDAQRSRRVLDRIVGYDVSALVWSKLAFGLSAGRVQSVALRLIVEREREIEAFVPEEYWNVGVALRAAQGKLFARLHRGDGEKLPVGNGEQAGKIRADLEGARYRVKAVARKEQRRHAPAPYTTSKLQQDASSYLRFPTKRTMSTAQKLYEGVDLKKDGGVVGLITYMRTDSTRMSPDAVQAAREYIRDRFGAAHLPEKPNIFRSRKNAQDAHEAIRPTSLEFTPELVRKHLSDEQYKVYKLIWDRFVACQMSPAVYDQTTAEIEAVSAPAAGVAPYRQRYELRATGRVLKFAGWLAQYQAGRGDGSFAGDRGSALAGEDESEEPAPDSAVRPAGTADRFEEAEEDALLPPLTDGESLAIVPPGVVTEQKFTQPPPRYNEGSLVRELEKRGIGRPSTYAEIISKVQARDYVEKLPGGQMKATELGKLVVDGLVAAQLDFMDPSFTAKMEEDLDEVGAGHLGRVDLLTRFYGRFREVLDRAKKAKRWAPEPVVTDELCPTCGKRVLRRWSKNGYFLGCEGYPDCRYTRNIGEDGKASEPVLTDHLCDKCGKRMVKRSGRFGEFLACSDYPTCKSSRPVPLGVPCPKCGGDVVEIRSKKRAGKSFWGCARYPECDFRAWNQPVAEACPQCQSPYLVMMGGTRAPKLACPEKGCGYSRPAGDGADEGVPAPAPGPRRPAPVAPKAATELPPKKRKVASSRARA